MSRPIHVPFVTGTLGTGNSKANCELLDNRNAGLVVPPEASANAVGGP